MKITRVSIPSAQSAGRILALLTLLVFSASSSLIRAGIAFQEDFLNNSGQNKNLGYSAQPWTGYKGGSASTSVSNAVYLPFNDGNPNDNGGMLGINASQGGGATQYVAVTTFPAIQCVNAITWTMGNVSDLQQVYILVQSKGNWYVSTQAFSNANYTGTGYSDADTDTVTQTLIFSPNSSFWQNFTLEPNVSMAVGSATKLPTADITGIGFYVVTGNTTMVRIDHLKIETSPEPVFEEYFLNNSGYNKSLGYLAQPWTGYKGSNASTIVTNAVYICNQYGNPNDNAGWLGINAGQGGGATQYAAVTTFSALEGIDTISWTMGNVSDEQEVHLLVQSDGDWYVSTEYFTSEDYTITDYNDADSSSVTYPFHFTTDASAWKTFTLVPNNAMTVGTASALPDSSITGVGFYAETGNTSIIRIDALTIDAAPARSVEQLPLDRFDEYQANALPPHPWYPSGLSPNVDLLLQKDSESPFPNNKYPGTGDDIYSGKGLVMTDTDASAGENAGIYTEFTPPPSDGKVYLGYDFRLGDTYGANSGQSFYTDLTDLQGRGLSIHHSISGGLSVFNAAGTETVLYSNLSAGLWYHVGFTIHPNGTVDAVVFVETAKKTRVELGSISLPSFKALRQLSFLNGASSETGVWAIDNICMAGKVDASRKELLPHEPSSTATLRASSQKVFGYYYPIYTGTNTISTSNPASTDPGLTWYTLTVLNPEEVHDDPARIDAGTELLYRPLPRPTQDLSLTPSENLVKSLEEEVRLAIQMGLDGFFADFSILSSYGAFNARSLALVKAAENVDPDFKIVPAIYSGGRSVIDGSGDLDVTPQTYAASDLFDQLDASPAVLHTDDGKMVFSMWLSERHSVGWWEDVFDELDQRDIDTVFIPHFNSTGSLSDFSPISYAMAHWGPRIPVNNGWIAAASSYTDTVIAPIASHDVRTRGTNYYESENFDTLRTLWACAIDDGADWAILNTWSDYTEQAMAPSTSIGFSIYDLNTYYIEWFKTGNQPTITRDVLYYSYRIHHTDIDPGLGVEWSINLPWACTPSNQIELLAFLKDAGTIRVIVNGQTYTQTATSAGIYSLKVPLPADTAFVPEFQLERNSELLINQKGHFPVLDAVEYPNFLYHSGVLPGSNEG